MCDECYGVGRFFLIETIEICPHKSDYCEECFQFKRGLISINQRMNMLQVLYYLLTKLVNYSLL